ncbi:MAG: hypothetical protein JW844_00545 [Candidatus Omnitrophica bacterium]|nr:hypothetical protein [Candidatus Omnitrophota bacterium]
MKKISPSITSSDTFSYIGVLFFSALILLLETVFFHILIYLYDYFIAVFALGFVVLGIGLGAFLAQRIHVEETRVFWIACLATSISLYVNGVMLVAAYPLFWVLDFFIALTFSFPTFYIVTLFKNRPAHHVYLSDMTGAFLGVAFTVILYQCPRLDSELILLAAAFVISLIGFVYFMLFRKRRRPGISIVFIVLILLSFHSFFVHFFTDSFNLFRLMRASDKEPGIFELQNKSFHRTARIGTRTRYTMAPNRLVKSYDSLYGRLEIIKRKKSYGVSFNGFGSDHFTNVPSPTYEDYYRPRHIRWPSRDVRLLYGIVEEPRIFIVGSSACGILKSAKRITPLSNITACEMNPDILRAACEDFYPETGYAYKGIKTLEGNALSLLKGSDGTFDMITFINTHSTRCISYQGAPDYLHTAENYALYFSRLDDGGFLNFEERVIKKEGKLALYKMMNTLFHSLKSCGAKSPEDHFFIWDWSNHHRRYNYKYYASLAVFKEPIDAEIRRKILSWVDSINSKKTKSHILYLKGVEEDAEYQKLFRMISSGDFTDIQTERFDSSIATNNRPFVTIGGVSAGRLGKLVSISGAFCLFLWGIFTIALVKEGRRRQVFFLNLYNLLIGMAYFFLEIILMQTYQNVFVTTSSTLLFILGVLLLSSGIGGTCVGRMHLAPATVLLLAFSLMAVYLPGALLGLGVPIVAVRAFAVFLVAACGFCMGGYFPKGLFAARAANLSQAIPYLFAVNAISGSFAVIFGLFLGVRYGYQLTVLAAVSFYAAASYIMGALKIAE